MPYHKQGTAIAASLLVWPWIGINRADGMGGGCFVTEVQETKGIAARMNLFSGSLATRKQISLVASIQIGVRTVKMLSVKAMQLLLLLSF